MAFMGVKPRPPSSSAIIFRNFVLAQPRCRIRLPTSTVPGIPILPRISGRKPSFPAAYTKRPDVKVAALSAPKQEAQTVSASESEPREPKTVCPKETAMVVEVAMVWRGRTST